MKHIYSYQEKLQAGRKKRNACLFYRKDTIHGEFGQPVCEKVGCMKPALTMCLTCNMFRSCLNAKERKADAHMRAKKKVVVLERICHSCNTQFSTTDVSAFYCSSHCRHSLRRFMEMEGR